MLRSTRRAFSTSGGWTIAPTVATATGRQALVVTMTSNPVNAINPQWLDDCDKAIAVMRREKRPVVITGVPTSNTFCAGLDLIYLFGIDDMAESRKRTTSVLLHLGECIKAILSLPVPTVAALSGHALAGGAILGNACDFRVGVKGSKAHFGAIEVPVGVPFPTMAFAVTQRATPVELQRDAILLGRRFGHDEAAQLGLFKSVAQSSETLVQEAAALATQVSDSALPAYALVKEQFSDPLLRYINGEHERVFAQVLGLLYGPEGWAHIRKTVSALQAKKRA